RIGITRVTRKKTGIPREPFAPGPGLTPRYSRLPTFRLRMDDPDLTLLRRFTKGEDAALGELAARYERTLLGLAMGLLSDRELAKDAVQETWLRVIKSARHFAGNSTVKTWVYRILINRALDLRQRRERMRLPQVPDQAASPVAAPDQAAHHLENGQLLRHAVDALTPDQRLIL